MHISHLLVNTIGGGMKSRDKQKLTKETKKDCNSESRAEVDPMFQIVKSGISSSQIVRD